MGEPLPEEKLRETFGVDNKNMDTPKSAVACLKYLMMNAAKYNTDTVTFNEELQQLGFPKEHAGAICKVMDDYLVRIRADLAGKILSVDEVEDIGCVKKAESPFVQVQFKVKGRVQDGVSQKSIIETINVNKNDVPLLLKELKTALGIMKQYEEKEGQKDE